MKVCKKTSHTARRPRGLCKQNKQLPVTITSTLLSRFAKLGGRDPPHGGEMRFYKGLFYYCRTIFWNLIDVCGTDTEFFLTRRMAS